MTIKNIQVFFGVIFSWRSLINCKVVPQFLWDDDDVASEFIQLVNRNAHIVGFHAQQLPHDMVERYHSDRPTYGSKLPMYFPGDASFIVLGFPVGTYGIDTCFENPLPDIGGLGGAVKLFEKKFPKEILCLGGKPSLHFVPDGCVCCK